ncbi:MAG TPA: CpaF family protein [Blastocatellia bacterium]|nr:CpaF family protein [Blastocatellia bacterium]
MLDNQNGTAARTASTRELNELQELKTRVHRKLINKLDLAKLENADPVEVQNDVKKVISLILDEENAPLSGSERENVLIDVLHEIFGLGPLEPLLADKTISDILVNGWRNVYIERRGKLERADATFRDDAHLMQIIDRIVSRIGRRIDESSPMVDARLEDGSRVNAIIPPLALDGPVLSIRRFGADPLTIKRLVEYRTIPQPLVQMLEACVKARLNILISGGTGAGKTTLLNCLSGFIPNDERLVTIEDSAELLLQQPHVVRLETRPPNIEGRGEVTQRNLLRNALRMRPDRIIVGEVRGEEAVDMLQAMNTGHDGGMTTIHANSPRDALARLETMIAMANLRLSDRAMRQQLSSAINLVVQISRMSDGTRKIMSVSEVNGMEGEVITMQEIYGFVRTGLGPRGEVGGHFRPTGLRPAFSERLEQYGFKLPANIFEPNRILQD